MGIWSRVAGNSNLTTLRLIPLAIGAVVMAVMLFGLRRRPTMTSLEKTAVLVCLLGSTTFLRTTHNLRMDIVLGLYAACILWGLLRFFDSEENARFWAVMSGASLFIGTQGVPPVALAMGTAIGLVMLLWAVSSFRSRWFVVALYAASSALALFAYFFIQFLPDIPGNLDRYLGFASHYTGTTGLGSFKLPFAALATMIRFSLSLSPIALGLGLFALLGLLWRGSRGERAIILVTALTLVIVSLFFNISYSYFVVFAPLAAYAAGRLMRWKVAVLVSAFVLFPALLSPPIHDLWQSLQDRPNGQMVANDAPLTSIIPEQAALVADDRLWFTLHQNRNFIGWNGISSVRREEQRTLPEALISRDIAYVICSSEYGSRCDPIIETGLFALSQELPTEQETYSIYRRQ